MVSVKYGRDRKWKVDSISTFSLALLPRQFPKQFLRSVFSSLRASSSGILDPSAYGFGIALAEELWVEIGSPGRSDGGAEKPSFSPPPPKRPGELARRLD